MSGDELRIRVLQLLQNIVSTLKRFFDAFAGAFHGESNPRDSEYVTTVAGSRHVREDEAQHMIDLYAESIQIDKEKIAAGEVTIRKEMVTETQMIAVPVTREELVIERKSDRGTSIELLAGRNQIRIPISHERVVIRKHTVLNERVSVARRHITETRRISTPVRHEELRVEERHSAPETQRDKAA